MLKAGYLSAVLLVSMTLLSGCSTNPATGESQFDGLMSRESEASIGAEQHTQILKQYGGTYNNPSLTAYVNEVGQRVARNTERPEVHYTFTLLDSPIVNAFALPGGYVYVTRGLLAVANDEAELAGVLGHEIGHVTARHQAARYSQGLLTTLGASVIGAAVGDANVARALGVGNNLYMSSYSRDQESKADQLGIRYLSRAGYDTFAVSDFLDAMGSYTATESRIAGKQDQEFSYFSSHPQTADRVAQASAEAGTYSKGPAERGQAKYLSAVRGMTYGDNPDQGVTKGHQFLHPKLGFAFEVPAGYKIVNEPSQVVAAGKDGSVIVLDMDKNERGLPPASYMMQDWMKGERPGNPETLSINGLSAATDQFPGTLNGRAVTIRVVAIQWSPTEIFRFQMAMPQGVGAGTVEGLKRTTYSFRRLTQAERASIRPQIIQLVTAKAGDTVESLAGRMQVDAGAVERFKALNALKGSERIESGRQYKIISEK